MQRIKAEVIKKDSYFFQKEYSEIFLYSQFCWSWVSDNRLEHHQLLGNFDEF